VNLKDDRGFSLFHEIALQDRCDLIAVLYDLGLIESFHKAQVTNPGSEFNTMTPQGLAEHKKKRCREEIEIYTRRERALNKTCKYARAGNVVNVTKMVNKNVLNAHQMSEEDGSYPIYWAVVANSYPCVKALLDCGVDLDITLKNGEKVLTKACSLGHADLALKLVREHHLDPNQKGAHGRYVVEKTAEAGDFALFQDLLSEGAQFQETVLHCASRQGQTEFIKKLRKSYPNRVNLNCTDQVRRTPLLHAADSKSTKVMQYLLEQGADFTLLDHRGRSVLHYAANKDCTEEALEVLKLANQKGKLQKIINAKELYLGAEQCFLVRGRDKGRYAWHYVTVDRALISIFQQVINNGRVDVTRYGRLLKSGWGLAPPQDTSDAISKKYDSTVLQAGIEPDMSALHYAILRENEILIIELIKYGADVNIQDSFGLGPLHMAAMRGMLTVVQALEAHGARMLMEDNKGRTALVIAEANRQSQVANYLRSQADIHKLHAFVARNVSTAVQSLDITLLHDMRQNGQDIRRHVIEELRELEAGIQSLLFELGTTPVMQTTSSDDTGTTRAAPTTP